MIKLPNVNKKNWKKILREINEKKYPDLPPNLKSLKQKMLNKEPLAFSEESLGYARLINYFKEFEVKINELFLKNLNYDKFNNRPPLEHQKPAVEFLLKNNRCILGDDMGLGKSASAIYASLNMDDSMKVLLVTMKSLKYNFYKEISYFDDRITVIDKKWTPNKFTIVHYESLKKFKKEITEESFGIFIVDEAHLVKNAKTQRTKALTDILKDTEPLKLWLLTGTPIANRPLDFYNLLKLIKHPIANNWMHYVQRYCDGHRNVYGQWEIKGASNLSELHQLTKDSILRRVKERGKDGMPNKTRRPVFFELKNTKGYKNIISDYCRRKEKEVFEETGEKIEMRESNVEEMTKLTLYRQFCALEKINDGTLIGMINDQFEDEDTNKIVIFSNFTKVLDAIKNHFGNKCLILDGRITDPKKRQEIVDDFNSNPDYTILAANLQVGGTGYNMQAANKMIINDMSWIPSNMLQAEDREWRLGQTRDVEILYPIYDKTAEEIIYSTVEEKMKIISTVIEGKEGQYFESEEIEVSTKDITKDDILKAIFAQLK